MATGDIPAAASGASERPKRPSPDLCNRRALAKSTLREGGNPQALYGAVRSRCFGIGVSFSVVSRVFFVINFFENPKGLLCRGFEVGVSYLL